MKNYKGYTFFYTNGSSHTKGGGLEEPELRHGWPARDEYFKKYGVTWSSRDEINWPTRLSEKLGIKVYNEAECGAGLYRSIRMSYDFIEKNINEIGNFFIILEMPDVMRLDVYFKPRNQYYIVNTHEIGKLKWATPNYYPKREEDDQEQQYFENYVDLHVDWNNIKSMYYNMLIGFYSYCKRRGVPIKLLNRIEEKSLRPLFDDKDLVSADGRYLDIFNWSIDNKCLIWDEIDNVEDGHPGYFGHIKYAEYLKNWLDYNLENSIRG